MNYKLAVIGVGNMAKAIIAGIQKSDVCVSDIYVFDTNISQYDSLEVGRCEYTFCNSIANAVQEADCVLLSVKPQNFPEILCEIRNADDFSSKLYITIAAGIAVSSVSEALNGADVVRVLPNLPMTIGMGVSVICKNENVSTDKFNFITSLFESSGSTVLIDECEMNRIIGVTSSSPAYVFKFIDAMLKGAEAQGLRSENLLSAVCDVFIGSAMLLKQANVTPQELISKVASKGGTTEQALLMLENAEIDDIIKSAMTACTQRADELGNSSSK